MFDSFKLPEQFRVFKGGFHPELASAATDRWFGMELNYDWGSETNKNQFNGNISSVTWRSKGDGVQRGYGYTYDNANRIMSADFCERAANSNAYTDNANVKFDMVMSSGDPAYSGYDANGNIKGMTQWGLELNSSSMIDQLKYDYYQSSNKLSAVSEVNSATKHKLGDFTDNNTSGNDYGYDLNGNMTTDLNKRIKGTATPDLNQAGGAILYNHLNLPWKISIKKDDNTTSKGYILYRYDATGSKLSKTVHEEGGAEDKVTDYAGGMVYEQNILQFIAHEEGRTRIINKEGVVTHNYDYFLKDHLGNVRMVLTDQTQSAMYPAATMETAQAATEESLYNLNATRADLPAGYPNNTPESNSNYPAGSLNQKVAQLSADGTDKKVGPSITLKVMAGDTFNARVSSWYRTNSVTPTYPASSILTDLGLALASGLGSVPGVKATSAELSSSNVLAAGANAMVSQQNNQTVTSRPKAFLSWMLYDDQFHHVEGGVQQVPVESAFYHNTSSANVSGLMFSEIAVTKSGYLYVFVSNETQNIKVYFDNLQVTHTKGPLLEETHYHPFGLTMAGISSKAAGGLESKKKFQGQEFAHGEFNDGSGLEMYEFKWRMDDPQTGRFWQVDPLADKYVHNSTYAFSENKVTSHVELEGLEAQSITDGAWRELQSGFQHLANWVDSWSIFNKSSTSTVVSSTPVSTTSAGTTVTTSSSTNLGENMSYIIANNSNQGNTASLTKTTTTVTADTKTDIKTPVGTITNKTSVSTTGVVTNETGAKRNVVIEGMPTTVGGSVSTSTNGQTTATGQASTNTGKVQAVGQAQYSTNGNQQSAAVGVGAQTTAGKTTTVTIFGIKFTW